MSKYSVPPQYPYQGNPGYSLSRYSVPGEDYPESDPPVSPKPTPKQEGRVDLPVPPTQTPPSREDVEELKQGRVDPPASMSQTTLNKSRERDPNGMGSVEKQRHRNDSKKELQKLSNCNDSDQKRDDKVGKGDRPIAHKDKKDNPGTTTSTWGFGWLSNSRPEGDNSESIESIAEESASTESAGSFTSEEDSSSEEDSRYSFVVPSDSSDVESSSSDDDSEFSLSGIDDSMFSV